MIPHELWVCAQAAAILVMSFLAAVSKTRRTGIILFWLSSVVFGAIVLAEGQEFLGLVFWMMATLQSLVLLFFSLLFGEFESEEGMSWMLRKEGEDAATGVPAFLGLALAMALAAIFCLPFIRSGADLLSVPQAVSGGFGAALLRDHWLALLFVGVFFAGIGIGAGVISRTDGATEPGSEGSGR